MAESYNMTLFMNQLVKNSPETFYIANEALRGI
jgi:hypothetical protein